MSIHKPSLEPTLRELETKLYEANVLIAMAAKDLESHQPKNDGLLAALNSHLNAYQSTLANAEDQQ
jgi:hypothetical protein